MNNVIASPKETTKNKIIGIKECSNLRKLYKEKKHKDIFPMYIGTCELGVLEIIFRGKDLSAKECKMLIIHSYLCLPEVIEAITTVKISNLTWKLKYPLYFMKCKKQTYFNRYNLFSN